MLIAQAVYVFECGQTDKQTDKQTRLNALAGGYAGLGKEYNLMCVVCCSVIDVAFVVDSSSKSQGQTAWNQMISFVNLVIDRLTISEYALRVAFVRYGDTGSVEFQFRTYSNSQSTKQRVSSITYLGSAGNNLANALDLLRTQVFQARAGARSLAPWVAVVVTDRSPSIRAQDTVRVANQARAATIQIIPVGVLRPGQLDRNLLNQIAFTQERVSTVNNYGELTNVVMQVANWICNSHLSESRDDFFQFISERDTYVHVRYKLSPFRLSVCLSDCLSVVCLSVTLVRPTQPVEIIGNFSHHTIAQGPYFSGAKNRWWGTPLSP